MAHGTGMTESYLHFNFPIEIYQASFPIVRVAYLKNAIKLALQKKISLLLCFFSFGNTHRHTVQLHTNTDTPKSPELYKFPLITRFIRSY